MLEEVLPGLRRGPLRARVRLQLAEIRSDEPQVAVELMEDALEDAGDDDEWRVKIASELAVAGSLRLIPLLAGVELQSEQLELAHARLEKLRGWLLSSGFGPAGYGKIVVWSQDVEAPIALGRLDEAEHVLAELRVRATVSGSAKAKAVALRSAREGVDRTARQAQGGGQADARGRAGSSRANRSRALGVADSGEGMRVTLT